MNCLQGFLFKEAAQKNKEWVEVSQKREENTLPFQSK